MEKILASVIVFGAILSMHGEREVATGVAESRASIDSSGNEANASFQMTSCSVEDVPSSNLPLRMRRRSEYPPPPRPSFKCRMNSCPGARRRRSSQAFPALPPKVTVVP